jgi:hypothetical protein
MMHVTRLAAAAALAGGSGLASAGAAPLGAAPRAPVGAGLGAGLGAGPVAGSGAGRVTAPAAVETVAFGCGPGWAPGPYGRCRPIYGRPRVSGPRCFVRPTPYGPRRVCRD